jgi:hypothetical protein
MHLHEIFEGLDEAHRRVTRQENKAGQINGASRCLAQQIVALKDWAAEQPEELLGTEEIMGTSRA